MTTYKELQTTGKYLPPALRDFHAQKDVFKAIHATINVEGHEYAGNVDWVTGHCYVVDVFLWFMAKHGYTLQKSRINADFVDLHETVERVREATAAEFATILDREGQGQA